MNLRDRLERETISWLEQDPGVQMAARVGYLFKIDPAQILSDGGDPLINQVRIAAANVVAEDKRKENAEQERQRPRAGAGRRPSRGRKR